MTEESQADPNPPAYVPEEEGEEKRSRAAIARDKERMALPATYVDKFHTSYWRGHVRLALGERATYSENGTFWRFAALLEKKDVETLIERLQSVLKSLEKAENTEEEG